MKFPKWMINGRKEIFRRGRASFRQRALKTAPVTSQRRERGHPALRMIEWARAAEPPDLCRQDEASEPVTMRPPVVPQMADVFAGRSLINVEIGRLQKTGDTKEQRFRIVDVIAEEF